ncbi:hypothetical protein V7S43_004775 [Phytophthora oleae]|uniref:Uncharacterized protein n=1 Tax=Phytophthora oleae TaxID=2107226 RepID=A0ABD3FVW5_9STRA
MGELPNVSTSTQPVLRRTADQQRMPQANGMHPDQGNADAHILGMPLCTGLLAPLGLSLDRTSMETRGHEAFYGALCEPDSSTAIEGYPRSSTDTIFRWRRYLCRGLEADLDKLECGMRHARFGYSATKWCTKAHK